MATSGATDDHRDVNGNDRDVEVDGGSPSISAGEALSSLIGARRERPGSD
jgi:hypothetical protein